MKRFFIILVVLILLGVFAGRLFALKSQTTFQGKPQNILVQTELPTVTSTPILYAIPANLKIPKLHIDTTVEQVGLDAQKNMDVPKADMNVGWYAYGPKPGEKGNSVLAGHFDTHSGVPAVFYKLNDLQKGDEIMVTDENGKEYTFIVVSKDKYPVDHFPIDTVFGKSDRRYLNLITCDGVWQPSKKLYSDRLVVRTELKE